MTATLKVFLETYRLYEKFQPRAGAWWNGEWPTAVELPCRACGAKMPRRIAASKVAGFAAASSVYMIHGTCEQCASDGLIFWVEVNPREGWMRKAGQLPSVAQNMALIGSLA